jgi:ABC-type lipoprotein release transport system permease subunit
MPYEFVQRLAGSPIIQSIRHLRPALIRKIEWPEYRRQVVLMGVSGVVPLTHVSNPEKPLSEAVPPDAMHVGSVLASELNLKEGESVQFHGHPLTVRQIYPARGTKDDITLWIDLGLAQQVLNLPDRINLIQALECNCASIDRLAEIQGEISQVLGTEVQVIELATQAIARAQAREQVRIEGERAVVRMRERAAIQLALLTAAAVSLIGILALINVRERRAEIGVLRALGSSTPTILQLMLGRAAVVGVAGALLGVLLGTVLASSLDATDIDKQLPIDPSAIRLPMLWMGIVILLTPLLTLLASAIPAWWAARQDPALVLMQD